MLALGATAALAACGDVAAFCAAGQSIESATANIDTHKNSLRVSQGHGRMDLTASVGRRHHGDPS